MSSPRLDFTSVDASRDVAPYISYLSNINAWDVMAAGKRRRSALLAADGRRVLLDVGCGLGEDVRAMALAVGRGGRVVGVDASAALIAEARARTPADAGDVMFEVADAADMPFQDDAFDGARFERVLQHAADPERVLAETMRVVRPGGLIVACEPDWGSVAWDADPAVVRALVRAYEAMIRNPWMGRELLRRFVDAGLGDVAVSVEPLVLADAATVRELGAFSSVHGILVDDLGAAAADGFLAEVDARSSAGRLFGCSCLMVAAGRVLG